MRAPLDQVSIGGDRDDDAGARVATDSLADEIIMKMLAGHDLKHLAQLEQIAAGEGGRV